MIKYYKRIDIKNRIYMDDPKRDRLMVYTVAHGILGWYYTEFRHSDIDCGCFEFIEADEADVMLELL